MAAVTADRAMTTSWWQRSRTRSPRCLPTAIGARGRWSIGAATARDDGESTTSASIGSCATITCCCAGTLAGPSTRAATTVGSRSAESDRRWCSDGFEIACDNRERVRVAFALDCCDREAMSWVATTGGITGDMVRDLMVEAVEARFGSALPAQPIEWLTDNGSPYIARDTRSFAREIGLEPLTTAIREPAVQRHGGSLREDLQARLRRSHGPLRRAHRAAPT